MNIGVEILVMAVGAAVMVFAMAFTSTVTFVAGKIMTASEAFVTLSGLALVQLIVLVGLYLTMPMWR